MTLSLFLFATMGKQLRETVTGIRKALFGEPERLDKDLWLGRLADMLLNGLLASNRDSFDLVKFVRAVRCGLCPMYVRGYSHVFVSGPSGIPDCSGFSELPELEDAYQEIFSPDRVRQLVESFHKGLSPESVRQRNAQTEFLKKVFKAPRRVPNSDQLEVTFPGRRESEAGPDIADSTGVSPSDAEAKKRADTASNETRTIENGETPNGEQSRANQSAADGLWSIPGLQRLVEMGPLQASANRDETEWLKGVVFKTRSALQQFQLQAKLLKSTLTPNSALLKFEGSARLTVEQVLRRRSEFLTTYGLNLVSVRPEPGSVCLAIGRPERETVDTRSLWMRWPPTERQAGTQLLVAVREDDNELLILDPGSKHAPHSLIAGATGSGKSVLMQNMLLSIAVTNTPSQARIVLIDPKQGVDYFAFEDIPHLECGIIESPDKALTVLRAVVEEMDRRYRLFREARAKDLRAFNRARGDEERLPTVWVVHDEFAEWMLVDEYKDEVASIVGRLGVKARAAGIYLIFAAQRPDKNVMPMQLRANLGNRLVLRVDSEGTSELSLGQKGAEHLMGKGHLAARLEGDQDLCFAQVPYVEEDFLEAVTECIVRQQQPTTPIFKV